MFLVYHTAATSRSIYVTLIVSPWNTHNQFNVEWTVVIHTTLELCILLKVSEKYRRTHSVFWNIDISQIYWYLLPLVPVKIILAHIWQPITGVCGLLYWYGQHFTYNSSFLYDQDLLLQRSATHIYTIKST